jgi:hypothetical protein
VRRLWNTEPVINGQIIVASDITLSPSVNIVTLENSTETSHVQDMN